MNNSTLPRTSPKYSMYVQKPSSTGKTQEKSKLPKQKEGIGDTCIQSQKSNKMNPRRTNTYTPGYHPLNRKETLKDKLLPSKQRIPTLKLSKTLDQESISRLEGVSSPFWIKSLQETYHTLWSPIETDLHALGSNSLNSCSNVLASFLPSSQILTSKNLLQNLPKTSCQSLRFSQLDTMDLDPIRFCRKMRFYPTKHQVPFLNQCIGASRFFFNRAVSILNERGVKGLLSLPKLRPLVMTNDKDLKEESQFWQKNIPYDTRQEAISDAITAFKGCLTKLKKGQITQFKVSYKSKKTQQSEAFRVNKKTLNPMSMSFFPEKLKKNKRFRIRKRDMTKFMEDGTTDGNFMILKTRPDKWYFCFPREKEQPIFENPVYKSVFLDPGVRTFQTFYSPDGICGKIGDSKFNEELKKIADHHDKLWSISDAKETSLKTKKTLRRRCSILRNKLRNKVDDLHWRTCSFLCKTFQTIFIPSFKVSHMVQGSHLGAKITRKMLQLSHGKFHERLLYYGKTKNRDVYVVEEHFTTKTCGHCGNLQEMGGKKVFECSFCNFTIDRDYNGARNICLKLIGSFL